MICKIVKVKDSFGNDSALFSDLVDYYHGNQREAAIQYVKLLSSNNNIEPEFSKIKDSLPTYNNNSSRNKVSNSPDIVPVSDASSMAKALLPNLSKIELQFVDKSLIRAMGGNNDFGLFKNGIIYIAKDNEYVPKKVLRHEILHKIFNQYISSEERNALINHARNKFNLTDDKYSDDYVEEVIANDFSKFSNKSANRPLIKRILDKIQEIFKFIFRNSDLLDSFYNKINRGTYSKQRYEADDILKNYDTILDKFGSIEMYSDAKNFISDSISMYLKHEDNTIPLRNIEIKSMIYNTLDELIENSKSAIKELDETSDSYEEDLEYEQTSIEMYEKLLDQNNFNFIIHEVFPSWDNGMSIIKDISYDNSEFSEDELKEDAVTNGDAVNNNEYEQNSDENNPLKKLSDSVKFFCSTIKESPDSYEFLDSKYVLVKLMQLFENVDSSKGTDDILNQLIDNNDFIKGAVTQISQFSPKDNTIYTAVEDLVYSTDIDKDISSHIKFAFNPNTGEIDYLIVSKSGKIKNDTNLITAQFDANKNDMVVIKRKEGQTNADFFRHSLVINEDVQNALNKTNLELLNTLSKAYWSTYNYNTLSELITFFNSLKEQNVKIIIGRKEYGTTSFKYIKSRATSKEMAVHAMVENAIFNTFRNQETLNNFYSNYNERLLGKKYVTETLKLMGIPIDDNFEYENGLDTDIKWYIVNNITRKLGKQITNDVIDNDTDDTRAFDEGDTIQSVYDIIGDEGRTIDRITNIIVGQKGIAGITSVKSASGKKRYVHTPSSWGSNLLKYMQKHYAFSNYRVSTLEKEKPFSLPKFITNSKFLLNNILIKFNEETVKVSKTLTDEDGSKYKEIKDTKLENHFEVVDHNGIDVQQIGRDDSIISYAKEKFEDYVTRVFTTGFMQQLNANGTYIQYTYTPSNRKNPYAAQLNVLTMSEIKDVIIPQILRQYLEQDISLEDKIDNYKVDSFVNAKVFKDAFDKAKISLRDRIVNKQPYTNAEISALTDYVVEGLNKESEKFADLMIENKVNLGNDMHTYIRANNYVDYGNVESFANSGNITRSFETWKETAKRLGKTVEQVKKDDDQRLYKINKETLLPFVKLFTFNSYTGSMQLTQLLAGNSNFYNKGITQVKRMSMVYSPGQVENAAKMTPTKYVVLQDSVSSKEDIITTFEHLFGDKLPDKIKDALDDANIYDGGGFMLPERLAEHQEAMGASYNLGNTMKPVAFGIDDNGVTRAVKYSSVVLSDELCEQFPKLAILRDKMRKAHANEAVFKSAIKVGAPKDEFLMTEDEVFNTDKEFDENACFEVTSQMYRMQMNPVHHFGDESVFQPTQINFLINALQTNQEIATKLYSSLNSYYNRAYSEVRSKYFDKDGLIKESMRDDIAESLSVNNPRLADMVKHGIPYNFPTLVDNVIRSLASSISREVTNMRFKGGKFVLQPDLGIEVTQEGITRKLKYNVDKTKGDLYAEVILPKGLLPKKIEDNIQKALDDGDIPPQIFTEGNHLLGFRIPSSELHSTVPIRIAGFRNENTNIVIAPQEIVTLHGSDFDVDSLFVIAYDADADDKLIGFSKSEDGRYAFNENLDTSSMDFNTFKSYIKNQMLWLYQQVSTDKANRVRMITPISMKVFKTGLAKLAKSLYPTKTAQLIDKGLEGDDLDKALLKVLKSDVDLSNPSDMWKTQKSSMDGSTGTGIVANYMKVLIYASKAGLDGSTPTLLNEFKMSLNGKEYGELQDSLEIITLLNSLLNSTIDNVKEQDLPFLNLSNDTLPAYMSMLAVGIDFDTANFIMRQPIMDTLVNIKGGNMISNINSLSNKIKQAINTADVENDNSITLDSLSNIIRKNYHFTNYDFTKVKDIKNEKERNAIVSDLTIQIQVLKQFAKAYALGKEMSNISIMFSIIKNLKNTKPDIDNVLRQLNSMFTIEKNADDAFSYNYTLKDDYPIRMDNLLSANPHLGALMNITLDFNEKIKSNFFKHSDISEGIVKSASDAMSLDMDSTKTSNIELIKNEFSKFITTYTFSRYTTNKYISNDGIKTISYASKNEKSVSKTYKITPEEKFSNDFAKLVEDIIAKYAKDEEENKFLEYLKIENNYGLKSIKFVGGINLPTEEELYIKAGFEMLKYVDITDINTMSYKILKDSEVLADGKYNEFQKAFMAYAVYNYGLNIGSTNYSSYLPERMIKEFADVLNQEMEMFDTSVDLEKSYITGSKTNLSHWFNYMFMVNHPELLKSMSFEVVNNNSNGNLPIYYGEFQDGNKYDYSYFSNNSENAPKFCKKLFGKSTSIYKNIYQDGSRVYYAKIAQENKARTYRSDDFLQDLNPNTNAASSAIFDAKLSRIYVANNDDLKNGSTNSIPMKSTYRYKKGDVIRIINYNDSLGLNGIDVKVIDVNNESLKVTLINSNPINIDLLIEKSNC